MIIFVAGMPRSGSMWTYNIVRTMLRTLGRNPLPEEIPLNEMPLISKVLALTDQDKRTFVIKTHCLLPVDLRERENVRLICNYRDVRDAMLSFKRFTHASIDDALSSMLNMMQTTDYYFEHYPDALKLHYGYIKQRPVETVIKIAVYLNITLDMNQAECIAAEFSQERVRQFTDYLKQLEEVKNNVRSENINKDRFVKTNNLDNSTRLFDKLTAFQSNHITSDRDGEWLEYFTREERDAINNCASEWLSRYGFSI